MLLIVTACACSELGSELMGGCDAETGQCKCRERYIGRACDSCQVYTSCFSFCILFIHQI